MTGDHQPHALLRPNIVIPFALVALIWGSTWLVIKDQIDSMPPGWSIVWRFLIAGAGMFALAMVRGDRLRIGADGHRLALLVGVAQFCGNFSFVYRAELHLTSGIVATCFGLLLIPNAILARIYLKSPITPGFVIGSTIALAGIGLLLLHEARIAPPEGQIALGIMLTAGGILAASIANVVQAGSIGRSLPMASLLAWSIVYGLLVDIPLAWLTEGAPVLPPDGAAWAGVAFLALAGSVVTFPLYYKLARELGPGRAAYNGVVVVIIAMILSTFFEDYRWSWLAGTGAVLALIGMLVALRARNPVR